MSGIPDDSGVALGILRRPQTDADRGPRVQAVLSLLSARGVDGVHRDGVRLLAERPDGVTVLVPRERAGADDSGDQPSIPPDALCITSICRT